MFSYTAHINSSSCLKGLVCQDKFQTPVCSLTSAPPPPPRVHRGFEALVVVALRSNGLFFPPVVHSEVGVILSVLCKPFARELSSLVAMAKGQMQEKMQAHCNLKAQMTLYLVA